METKVIVFGTAAMLVLGFGIVSFILIYQKRQQQQRAELLLLNEQYQKSLLEASVDSQEGVRRQIGGDLHDDIGTLLSATRLSLAQMGRKLKEMPDDSKIFFEQTNELLDEAIGNVRRISKELMPSTLDEFGLIVALNEFVNKLSSHTGYSVQFTSKDLSKSRYNQKLELIFFRIMQELVNNSFKHADANNITIELKEKDNMLIMCVADNGKGYNTENIKKDVSKGIGLKNIESRLSVINGEIVVNSIIGQGTNTYISASI
jgi:signal transduction histidine kinase